MATMYPFPVPAHTQMIGYDGISVRGPFEGISVAGAIFDDPVPQKRKHSADPIKDTDGLNRISEYLVSSGRYRDNLLFVAGVNFGLRCGDLVQLPLLRMVEILRRFRRRFDGAGPGHYEQDWSLLRALRQNPGG